MDKHKPGGYLTVDTSDTGPPDKKKPGQSGKQAGLSSNENNDPSPQCTKPGLLSQFTAAPDRICSECGYGPASTEYYFDDARWCWGCHANHIQIQWHEWDLEDTRPFDTPRCDNAVVDGKGGAI